MKIFNVQILLQTFLSESEFLVCLISVIYSDNIYSVNVKILVYFLFLSDMTKQNNIKSKIMLNLMESSEENDQQLKTTILWNGVQSFLYHWVFLFLYMYICLYTRKNSTCVKHMFETTHVDHMFNMSETYVKIRIC